MYLLMLFLIPYIFIHSNELKSSCYNNLYNHFATKTPYRVIENKNNTPINYAGCEPLKIWMIIRHGSRLPSKNFIHKMNTRLPYLRDEILKNSKTTGTELNEIDLINIRDWDVTIDEIDEKILAHEGEDEMINLAERMQSRFPSLLPEIYSNTSYFFKYTDTQRTQQSAYYFTTGLFGRKTASSVWYPQAIYRDPILRFYKLCVKWRKEIKKNPDALHEHDLFINSTIVQNITKTISAKLGFTEALTYDDLYIMYITCTFESSWTKKNLSPWCVAFNSETIKIIEYIQDLKYYWIDGPGHKITYEQACPVIQDLTQYFNSDEIHPKAILYFTHSGTILKLLSHLGLYRDKEILKHNNYEKHSERLWRVSKIDAFASNIAAVLFKCGDTKKILFLHQERAVKIPGCSEELCDFNTFLNTFNQSIHNCHFEEMCKL